MKASVIIIGIIGLYGLIGFTNLIPDLSLTGMEEAKTETAREAAREQFTAQLTGSAQDYFTASDRGQVTSSGNERGLASSGLPAESSAKAEPYGVGGQPAADGILGEAMSGQDQPQEGERAKVKRVIDGDTIMLSTGEYVRYVGVDAPEPQSPYRAEQECYAEESKQRNAQLVFNQEVLLFSKPDEDTDGYGRLLRYIWVGNTHVNQQLIAEGYAYSYNFGHPHPYDEQFETAEQNAKQEKLGMWSACSSPQEVRQIELPQEEPCPSEALCEGRPQEDQQQPQDQSEEEQSQNVERQAVLPLQINRELIINEIRTQNGEFVELYNPTTQPANLAGYYFTYYSPSRSQWNDPWRSKEFPSEAVIQANGYYLIGLGEYPLNADWQAYTSNQLGNSAGTVALWAGDPASSGAARIDAVGWGETLLFEVGPALVTSSMESIVRIGLNQDTDNNANDFVMTATSTPAYPNIVVSSGGGQVSPPLQQEIAPAPLVINEIQINDSEFVELYNTSAGTVSLAGHYFVYYSASKIAWNDPWRKSQFPDGATISANGYYLIGFNDYPNADWQAYTSSQLSNSSGTVAIFPFDPSQKTAQGALAGIIDAAGWGTAQLAEPITSPAPAEVPDANESIARDYQNSDTNNNAADFTVGAPTPGASTPESNEEGPPPDPEPLALVINEIQVADNEFIEIYNISENDTALNGFYLAYYSSTKTAFNDPSNKWQFPDGKEIPVQSHFLIGVKGYPEIGGNPNTDWQLLTQAGTPYATGQLSNNNGTLALFSENPECDGLVPCTVLPLDAVAWGTDNQVVLKETQTAEKPGSGKSISRNESYADTENNFADFAIGNITPTNSTGETYSITAAGLYSGSVQYFCPPYLSSFAPQGVYTPSAGLLQCTYAGTNLWQGAKYGDLYAGTPGNAVIHFGHYLDNAAKKTTFSVTQADNFATIPKGPMFIAIYDTSSNPLINAFRAAFQTGGLPPNNKYGILEWILEP